ncbi:Malonyl-coenzyme A:anthocyanin 3-O-glucoside-6''-O-malonyltransferase [Thalictrum thalictroides]|uniref:Malonyl-coenzyme A:anthocyanin 3-O-glucoside-6''-O-malonyltransferase n=1 Tax=Thalictrum thalictroides TaxID=46969 RepID=A0A7J6X1K5_THATH|nr:Malonyl-coenzyme A:anthocyanin 3-O-glucoside-6''-O-malonyltransferase [Thalictrum thalictroides]
MGLSDIKLLKKWVSARLEMKAPLHLSSLVVTLAYVWVCLLKARWPSKTDHENDAEEHIIVPIDVRARLDPPLPVTYFGNCIGGVDVMCNRSVLIGKDGIAIAAKLIGKAIKNYDFYAQLERDLSYFMSIPKGQIEGVGSSPRFAVYDTDFGWGKPEKVEMNPIDGGQSIALSECPNEAGAIEIGLVRKKTEMDHFAYIFANSIEVLS